MCSAGCLRPLSVSLMKVRPLRASSRGERTFFPRFVLFCSGRARRQAPAGAHYAVEGVNIMLAQLKRLAQGRMPAMLALGLAIAHGKMPYFTPPNPEGKNAAIGRARSAGQGAAVFVQKKARAVRQNGQTIMCLTERKTREHHLPVFRKKIAHGIDEGRAVHFALDSCLRAGVRDDGRALGRGKGEAALAIVRANDAAG